MATTTKLWDGTRRRGNAWMEGVYYEAHQCGTCGVSFAVEHDYMEERRVDGQGWRCPNGHSFVYNNGEHENERLKRQLAETRRREQATRELLAAEERSHRTTRGHVTRKRKQLDKVGAGVCPVDGCHRHFQNLERHIASKHPEFGS